MSLSSGILNGGISSDVHEQYYPDNRERDRHHADIPVGLLLLTRLRVTHKHGEKATVLDNAAQIHHHAMVEVRRG